MKSKFKLSLFLIVAIGLVSALIFAYVQMSKERDAEAERDQPVVAESRVKVGAAGEPVLKLDRETQQRIALQVEPVSPAKMAPELKGYGRVLDPAPLAAITAELASAQAAAKTSAKEYARLNLLHEQQNAADRAVEAAEAATRRDNILVESIRARLVLGWGQAVAAQADQPAFIASLTSLSSALVRIDLPAGEALSALPAGGRIIPLAGQAITARLLGLAPNVDPQMQGQGLILLVEAASPPLLPGTAVEGFVPLAGEPRSGFVVPDSAVVRSAGQAWIYAQTGEDTFTRRRISLDHRVGSGWFVSEGVSAEERIVVTGAQTLLSEENKYQIKLLD